MAGIQGNYNHNTVDEIKSRCNIVDVIGRVVTLKKAGNIYKGLCPFHNEKTPSFVVYESSQTFKCFGCNEGGDVFTFVSKYYNLDFREAMEMLAKEYGVEIRSGGYSSKSRDEFYEINRQAARFFYRALREKPNPGYPYMRNRGITDETMKTFGIGFADEEWTSLTDHLQGMGYSPKKLVEVGLASEKNGRYYDKFRGRVMFPIQNTAGKVIGFGGRILDKGEPKYLNSRESAAFQKKNNLYGLNVSKKHIDEGGCLILVEGYMDVISLYQAGIRNVSASLGTALTENQAKLIKRYTPNVVLSYDADSAGQKAALRGLDILYSEGCRARVLVVTQGKDPDEFIKANGREAFLELVENAMPYGDFKLAKAREKYDLSDSQQKLGYMREAIEILKKMKPVEADMYIGKISEETGISDMAIRRELNSSGSTEAASREDRRERYEEPEEEMTPVVQNLLKLMILNRDYTNIPEDISGEIFHNAKARAIYDAIRTADKKGGSSGAGSGGPIDIRTVHDNLDVEGSDALNDAMNSVIPGGSEDELFRECVSAIRLKKLNRESAEITDLLRKDASEVGPEEAEKLMRRQMEIQRQIKGIGEKNDRER